MKIAVIGGGPSGMMASIFASKNNEVSLFEKNEKLGKKIFITGKGRCNITNVCDIDQFKNNIVTNSKFLYHSLSKFNNIDFYNFLEENGLKLKIERGKRVFPYNDKSFEFTDLLKKILIKNNVKIRLNTLISKIDKIDVGFNLHYENKYELFDKIIIATGGNSYKTTGSTGDGYKFAKYFNINIINPKPSLVPLIVKEEIEVSSIKRFVLKNVKIRFIYNNKTIYSDFGDIEFRNNEIAGPIIIKASSYLHEYYDDLKLIIDLKPSLDEDKLKIRIMRDIKQFPNDTIINELKRLLPYQLVDSFYDRLKKIFDANLFRNNISNTKNIVIDKIINIIKNYEYNVLGTKGFEEAIITKGGIDVKEIDPKTMESKKIKGLYFCGEVLDIDALTGGYNITIAAITGYIAGISCDKYNY